MFSLTLPHKVKGQYWVTDIDDNGKPRDLISVEAVDGSWVVKSNKSVSILNSENKPVENTILKPSNFFNLKIAGSDEIVKLLKSSTSKASLFAPQYLNILVIFLTLLVLNLSHKSRVNEELP